MHSQCIRIPPFEGDVNYISWLSQFRQMREICTKNLLLLQPKSVTSISIEAHKSSCWQTTALYVIYWRNWLQGRSGVEETINDGPHLTKPSTSDKPHMAHTADTQQRRKIFLLTVCWTIIIPRWIAAKLMSASEWCGEGIIGHNYYCFQVSWMRNYDGYPLFIGHEKYINDQRFELVSRRWERSKK